MEKMGCWTESDKLFLAFDMAFTSITAHSTVGRVSTLHAMSSSVVDSVAELAAMKPTLLETGGRTDPSRLISFKCIRKNSARN